MTMKPHPGRGATYASRGNIGGDFVTLIDSKLAPHARAFSHG